MSATRPHLVGVRLSADEFAALTDASARTGKTAATLLRDTFLVAAAPCDWGRDHMNCCIARARDQGAADERAKWSAAIARHTVTLVRPAMGNFSEGVDVIPVHELRDLLGGR